MSSASKRKGSSFEREIVQALIDFPFKGGWPYAERRIAGAQQDKGDIQGVPAVCFEIKNQKTLKLAEWVDELTIEMKHAKADVGMVVHKRRGTTNAMDYYATMPLGIALRLLKEAGY
jgi:Holliday junction resolvase